MKATWKTTILFLILFHGASASGMTGDWLGRTDIHGFISQGYLKSTKGIEYLSFGTADGTFEFNEIGLTFSNEPAANLRVGMQLFAYDLGQLGNDEIFVDWAYADYKIRDYLGFRAGLIRIPYALHNETRDIDMLRTGIFLPASIYNELYRDLFSRFRGVSAYGSVLGRLSYQVYFGTGTIESDGQLASALNHFLDVQVSSIDIRYAYGAHFLLETPLDGFRIGSSAIGVSHMNMNATAIIGNLPLNLNFEYARAYSGFMDYTIGNLVITGEFTQYDIEAAVTNDAIGFNEPFVPTMIGYYGSIAYRFTDWLELGTYYSEFYFDRDDKDGKKLAANPLINQARERSWCKDTCFSVRFDIGPSWALKMETHFMNGSFNAVGDKDARNWEVYAAKVTFSF